MSPSSKRRTQTLQPIIEGETAHFWEEIKEEEEDERKEKEEVGEPPERKEEREEEEEEEDEEEEEGESSGGEMQSPEVIMAVDFVTSSDGSVRSQNQADRAKVEEGSGRLALDLRLSSSNASSMYEHTHIHTHKHTAYEEGSLSVQLCYPQIRETSPHTHIRKSETERRCVNLIHL